MTHPPAEAPAELTLAEHKVLYKLAAAPGQRLHRQALTHAIWRIPASVREAALAELERAELVHSGEVLVTTGPRPVQYVLTEAGRRRVAALVAEGWIPNPGA